MDGSDICQVLPYIGETSYQNKCYGTCDTGSGSCTNYTKTEGEDCNGPCDETDSGTCASGNCASTDPKVCVSETSCFATCDGSTGNCDDYGASDGKVCNDNHVCTKNDKCSGGTCAGNTPICSGE